MALTSSIYINKLLNMYSIQKTEDNTIYNIKNPVSVFEVLWSFDISYNDMIEHFPSTMALHSKLKKSYYSYSFHSLYEKDFLTLCNELMKFYKIDCKFEE
jgi:hypothetical protein